MYHRAEVLVTPTQDEGKLIAALHETKQGGDADLNTGIQVAQVSLADRVCNLAHPTDRIHVVACPETSSE